MGTEQHATGHPSPKVGEFIERPQPGSLVCWDRGKRGDWAGHIGIVSRVGDGGIFWSIEGNRGGFPAKVDEFKHVTGEGRLMGFAKIP